MSVTLVVVFVLGALFAVPWVALSDDGTAVAEPADHFVVEYSGQVERLEQAVTALGGTVDRVHNGIRIARVSGLSDEQAAELAQAAGVRSVTRDVIVQWVPGPEDATLSTIALPDNAAPQSHDPTTAVFFPLQWNMHIIDADDAWNAGFEGSPEVRVAIIDTGLDPFHIDLAGLIDESSSVAFTPSLNPAGPDWGDDHWHGTHVGGTVVTNGIGTSGVAPHTTLIAVKVLNVTGSGSFEDVIAGIMHAADVNADVINMSLGAVFPKNTPGGDFAVTGDPETSTVLAPCSTLSLVIPICQLGGFYVFAQGTSMATPHVAGAAALLDAQHNGNLNAGQLKTRLQQGADDLGEPGTDPFFGKGRLNVFNTLSR